MRRLLLVLFAVFLALPLTGCDTFRKGEASYPIDREDERRKRHGRLTGEDGVVLWNKDKNRVTSSGGGIGIGVNSFLWRATLDTIAFMPLTSADPFGGVIITDWYEDPKKLGERFKMNIVISDKDLRADALRVSVFKQRSNAEGVWQDAETHKKLSLELEDKILTRARELRITSLR